MTQSERPAMVVSGVIIAAIYVIMLIGLTRSSYFIGGMALERASRGPVIAVNRLLPAPELGRPVCTAPEAGFDEPQECVRATRALRRLLGLRVE